MRNPLLPNAQSFPPPRTPPGNLPVPRGAATRVRSDRRNDDPFAPTVQRHRDEQARAVPSYGHNPTVDVRLGDRPAWGNPNLPARAVSPIEVPPGDWVPGRVRAAAVRAAAAALPYADGRSMIRPAAAAPKARPMVPAGRPRARPVVYAEQDRSLPPRREVARRSPGRPVVHPENNRFLWSYLEKNGYLALRTLRSFREQDPGLLPLGNFGIHVIIRIGGVGD